MEAPEKIYLQQYDKNTLIFLNKWNISDEWTNKPFNEKIATNIEYTRTDAFIEKACDAYCRLCDTKECGDTGECVWVEKFRKRLMK